MVLAVEKTWLMHYPVLRLVNQCRRLIQSEFGVRPALHDERLREMLAHFAGRSRQRTLRETHAELRRMLAELEPVVEAAPENVERRRVYRGSILEEAEPEPDGPAAPATGGRIIYRGRVVRE